MWAIGDFTETAVSLVVLSVTYVSIIACAGKAADHVGAVGIGMTYACIQALVDIFTESPKLHAN